MMAQPGDLIERAILEICRDVCELPDRSSPEGEPDQVIVTLEELSDICRNVLTEAFSAIPIPAPTEEVEAVKVAQAIVAHYRRDPQCMAKMLDEVIDRSGATLGYVRELTRLKDSSK